MTRNKKAGATEEPELLEMLDKRKFEWANILTERWVLGQ